MIEQDLVNKKMKWIGLLKNMFSEGDSEASSK